MVHAGAIYDGASILAEALRLAASRAAKAAKTATSTGDSSNGKVTGGSSSSSGGKRAAAAAAEEEMAAAAAADEDDDDRGRGRGMKPQINGSSSSSSGARASGKSSGDNVSKEAAADDDDASAVPSGALLCSGASVRLVGLQARPDLNGHLAVCLAWSPSAGRWMVRDGTRRECTHTSFECVVLALTLACILYVCLRCLPQMSYGRVFRILPFCAVAKKHSRGKLSLFYLITRRCGWAMGVAST